MTLSKRVKKSLKSTSLQSNRKVERAKANNIRLKTKIKISKLKRKIDNRISRGGGTYLSMQPGVSVE